MITDYRLLVSLFKRSLLGASPTLAKMLIQVLNLDLNVIYQPGSQMHLVCALIRLSTHNPEHGTTIRSIDVPVHEITKMSGLNTFSLQRIFDHNRQCQLLCDHILQSFPDRTNEIPKLINSFHAYRDELAIIMVSY